MRDEEYWEKKIEKKLGGLLLNTFGTKSFPDNVLSGLRDGSYFSELASANSNNEPKYLKEAVDKAKSLISGKSSDGTPPPGRKAQAALITYEFSAKEEAYEEAIRSFLAVCLPTLPEVIEFRKHLPGSDVLSRSQAETLITSPIASLFKFADLKAWGVDVFTARGEIVHEERIYAENVYRATVKIQPGDFVKTAKHDPATMRVLVRVEAGMEGTAVVGEGLFDTFGYIPPSTPLAEAAAMLVSGRSKPVRGYYGTVLGEVLEIADRIARRYQLDASDCVMFLLTGTLPYYFPNRSQFTERTIADLEKAFDTIKAIRVTPGPLIMKVEPWLSSKTLAQYYRGIQSALNDGDNKLVAPGSLERFLFVNRAYADALMAGEQKPTWPTLLRRWQEAHPDNKQAKIKELKAERDDFRRLYMTVKEELFPLDIDTLSETEQEAVHKKRKTSRSIGRIPPETETAQTKPDQEGLPELSPEQEKIDRFVAAIRSQRKGRASTE